MVTSVEGLISEALMTKIATVPTIDIAFPNVYDSGAALPNKPYLDVTHIPNGRANQVLSGEGVRQGLVRMTLVKDPGEGDQVAQDEAGVIAALFPKNTKLYFTGGYVKLSSDPEVGQSFPDNGAIRTPIQVTYTATKV